MGVILAVSGSAVGLGNFLRFPGQAAAHGFLAFTVGFGGSMFRAFWINKVATEQQIEQTIDDKLGFRISKILDQIKQGYFSDRPPEEAHQFDGLLQLLKGAWGPMCSYTHSGALQLNRRFTGNELKPNYSEGEIVQALNLVTVGLLLLLHTFFVSMGCPKDAEETGTMLQTYHADFAERLRATDTNDGA